MRGVKPPIASDYKIREDWLDRLLAETGFTLKELGKEIRASKQNMSHWKNRKTFPSGKMILAMIDQLKVDANLFIVKKK